MPSFFCGIFGHKPTKSINSGSSLLFVICSSFLSQPLDIVSNFEMQPVAEKVLQNYLVTGPMSRFCVDLLPMYRILAAGNGSKLKLDTKVSFIFVLTDR